MIRNELINYLSRKPGLTHSEISRIFAGIASGKSTGDVIVSETCIKEKDLAKAYIDISGKPFVELSESCIDRNASKMIPAKLARKHGFMPFKIEGGYLCIAMKDPLDLFAIEQARLASRMKVKVYTALLSSVNRTIENIYGEEKTDKAIRQMSQDIEGVEAEGEEAFSLNDDSGIDSATIRFVNSIINRAYAEHASDIHIEPTKEETVTRIRVDGVLRDIQKAPADLHPSIVARIKVMGNMDVAEKRIPQDGRSSVKAGDEEIDLRISSLPTVFGEKIVIRLLLRTASSLGKDAIGLRGENIKKYELMLENHNGVILMVGPTGSGKSTTMTTMIKVLNKRDVNIITLEDPVEYNIPGISQVQINEKTGMTFARGLRAAMRQDPDIICVGEIRDGETAEIAMRAAITGHLVISTVHTNDAVSTFERLKDMGVESYLIAPAIIGIVSQRLVRRICPNCKMNYMASEEEARELNAQTPLTLYKGRGCSACFGTGYLGRTGVFEILTMTPKLRRVIAEDRPHSELIEAAEESNYIHLKEAVSELVTSGETTFEEMKRTINAI